MAWSIQIQRRRDCTQQDLLVMHQLRAKVFKERMGWEVPVISGMEIDGYDALDPLYMLLKDEAGTVCGCWRVMPTEGPYMLKDSFPELLHGQPAPAAPSIWELSRFTIEADIQNGYGFADATLQSLKGAFAYGLAHGIEHYLMVTTTAIERMLRLSSAQTSRLGPPIRIGCENAVALDLDIRASYQRMFGALPVA